MALRTHNLHSGRIKENVFGEFDEEMFQGVENQCELIFSIFDIEKSGLDKVV
jgi:hypothetical protein